MDINERMEAKQAALLRAESHDLDVAAVAISAVSMIFEEIFPSLMPTLAVPKTPLAELSIALSPAEERLIKAIDWLCIHESTHVDAIVQANALMRLFLNNGRLNAARTLLYDQLPSDVIAKVGLLEADGDPDMQALEFIHWRSFFEALTQHMRYVEIWSKRPADKCVPCIGTCEALASSSVLIFIETFSLQRLADRAAQLGQGTGCCRHAGSGGD